MITGILVSHKNMSSGLMEAVESICGPVGDICCLSNQGLSTRDLADKIRECVAGVNAPALIFIDVYGGSCWRAAKMARVQEGRILSGVNLAMLLSFVNKRNSVALEELPSVLADDGRRGIILD